jgi:hypothetical protein
MYNARKTTKLLHKNQIQQFPTYATKIWHFSPRSKKNNQMIYIQEISKQKSSQACIKKSPLGQRKSSLFRQVTS